MRNRFQFHQKPGIGIDSLIHNSWIIFSLVYFLVPQSTFTSELGSESHHIDIWGLAPPATKFRASSHNLAISTSSHVVRARLRVLSLSLPLSPFSFPLPLSLSPPLPFPFSLSSSPSLSIPLSPLSPSLSLLSLSPVIDRPPPPGLSLERRVREDGDDDEDVADEGEEDDGAEHEESIILTQVSYSWVFHLSKNNRYLSTSTVATAAHSGIASSAPPNSSSEWYRWGGWNGWRLCSIPDKSGEVWLK